MGEACLGAEQRLQIQQPRQPHLCRAVEQRLVEDARLEQHVDDTQLAIIDRIIGMGLIGTDHIHIAGMDGIGAAADCGAYPPH